MNLKTLLLAASVIGVLGFQSCMKSNNNTVTTGNIMFFNGCAGNSGLYASVNSVAINNVSIPYNSILPGGYTSVGAGTAVDIAFINTGINEQLAPGVAINVLAGASYSAFAGGEIGGTSSVPYVVITTDTVPTSAYGTSYIRCINLSPISDSTTINVSAGSSIALSGPLAAKGYSSFTSIAAGTYSFYSNSIAAGSSVTLPNTTLTAGKSYTLVYSGTRFATSGSGYLPAFTLIQND